MKYLKKKLNILDSQGPLKKYPAFESHLMSFEQHSYPFEIIPIFCKLHNVAKDMGYS